MQRSRHSKDRMLGDAESILESITDAFFSVDENWDFTYANHHAEKVLGRKPGDLLGKNIWTEYPGLAGSEFQQVYQAVAAERIAGSITSYYPDHNRWYEVHVYPASPAARGIAVYFRDVTERVHTEQRLRESEMRFRLMAEAIPQIVWIADAAGRIDFFNRQWHVHTGAPPEATSGSTLYLEFVHPDDLAPTLKAWDEAQRNGRDFTVEHRIRSASGKYRWFLARAQAHRDLGTQAVVQWFGTSTDVHDRMLADLALQKSEERYRTLFESIDEGFCVIQLIFDQDGNGVDYVFCEVNPSFEQQTGLHGAVGKSMRELAPEHEAHWYDIYAKVARTGEALRFENEARALNRWFDVYTFRIGDPGSDKVAILFNDITKRKHAEEELRLADRRKDEFLAMLAHELRNPLAPIGAAADLLRLARLDEARVRQTSEVISRQVRHMTSLVDDLLDVSRVTRGLVTLDIVALDAKRVVADAVEQVRPLIETRRHHLAVHLPPDPAFVSGDGKRLVQVVSNLLNNAAKYTPEGGNIVLRTEVRPKHVLFAVADNGIGMPPELVDHVFDLFSQGARTSDRNQGGLGIGLAVVKSLAELHGGTIRADSAGVGKGSEFTVCLPRLIKPDDALAQRDQAPVPPAQKPLRLMVVDDNPDAARMLAMFLEAAGHEVIVEHDSTKVIERARIERPDVYLLDVGLPDLDGNQLARQLRSHSETAKSVIIAVTGYGHEQDKKSAASAGFDYHFVKPVDTLGLAALLNRIGAS